MARNKNLGTYQLEVDPKLKERVINKAHGCGLTMATVVRVALEKFDEQNVSDSVREIETWNKRRPKRRK